jgi:DNA modification methylase
MTTTDPLFDYEIEDSGPVDCLGHSFTSEQARRKHYLKLLAEKLKDPEFRKIEGFPNGTDEAILAMSDPPYYTACPNPFIDEYIKHYGKSYDPSVKYAREPLAIDVSVGKTDPIYKAHSYHTKVPHLAIVPSILHYTEPGDIVLDGFSGSGMTGVAAQWCGSAPNAYRYQLESDWKKQGRIPPEWGSRRVILNDLSPAATFISANYNIPFDIEAFNKAGAKILKDVENEIGWMYETLHTDGYTKAQIDYTVWSEVFNCSSCAGEIVFTDVALDDETQHIANELICPHCGAKSTKEKMDLSFESFVDPASGQVETRPKRVPVFIIYKVGKVKYKKRIDKADINIIEKIAKLDFPPEFPAIQLPDCQMVRVGRMTTTNTKAIHFMFLPRAAHGMTMLWRKANDYPDTRLREMLLFFVEQAIWGMSLLARYTPTHFSQVNQYLSGVFYIGSQHAECSPWYILDGKLGRLSKAFRDYRSEYGMSLVNTGTVTNLAIPNNSIDYVFTDPPFGENIYYSDLNFLVESWHGVFTNTQPEAIVDRVKNKDVLQYQHLMKRCFAEYYRVLKPGRWMTVVFSNSRASVWNAIQVSLQQVGFVVAEVTTLDKVNLSFQQVVSPNAVKQDLVISAYKPNGGLEGRFHVNGSTVESVWDFVKTHLKQLPAVKVTPGDAPELQNIIERDPRRLYDRMASWFIRHDVMVPISTPEFLAGLPQKFAERDGMIFLPEQVVEYDKKRMQIPQSKQVDWIVSDERSAIDWLSDFLKRRPSTYPEIQHEYFPVIGSAKKKGEIIPELSQLLEDNFLRYDGIGEVPSQIHSYLSTNHKDLRSLDKSNPALVGKAKDRWYVPDPNKAQDLDMKREKALLKAFEVYQNHSGRRLKDFRLEVLRTGFKNAWAKKDYLTIISVAQKIPEEALQEDEKLLLWYDQALTRTEEGI